jgi:hypothetical protein
MKKFLLNLLKFIAFAIPFYVIAICLWSWMMPQFLAKNTRNKLASYGHLYSRAREAENIKNPDILFLGSSHAYRGFDTRVFAKYGIKAFNLGSSSQSPINTQVFLKQYLDKIQPKFVVYEVYAGTLCTDGVESSLDMLINGKIDKNAVDMSFKVHNLMTYNTLIYGYFRQIFNLNQNIAEPEKQGDDFYVENGGFVETTVARENTSLDFEKSKWELNDKQIQALRENIEILQQRKIPFLLVQTPITKALYNSKTNNKEVDDLLNKLGKYKNFTGSLNFDDRKDFYDDNHMNQKAVVEFNEKFIEYLKTQNLKF